MSDNRSNTTASRCPLTIATQLIVRRDCTCEMIRILFFQSRAYRIQEASISLSAYVPVFFSDTFQANCSVKIHFSTQILRSKSFSAESHFQDLFTLGRNLALLSYPNAAIHVYSFMALVSQLNICLTRRREGSVWTAFDLLPLPEA